MITHISCCSKLTTNYRVAQKAATGHGESKKFMIFHSVVQQPV